MIANSGVYRKPFFIEKIESYDGKILYEQFINESHRFSSDKIYPLLDMMQGVVENGSGRVIRKIGFYHPAGGKTGTTNDFKDGWFTGFVKEFTTSVWVGFDNNDSMLGPQGKGITGSQAAAPIWAIFMKELMEGKQQSSFTVPPEIKFENVNYKTGYLAKEKTGQTIRVAVRGDLELSFPPLESQVLDNGPEETVVAEKVFQPVTVVEPHETLLKEPGKLERESLISRKENTQTASNQLDNQIWFMLNLKDASLGQIESIPDTWFLNMLKTTKQPGAKNLARLTQGRKNVIDHMISLVGSIDEKLTGGLTLRAVMLPSEIEIYAGRQ